MDYILIKDIRDLVLGNSYVVRYGWTNTITGRMYTVRESKFNVDNLSVVISEEELGEHFISKIVYKRNKIIEDLL